MFRIQSVLCAHALLLARSAAAPGPGPVSAAPPPAECGSETCVKNDVQLLQSEFSLKHSNLPQAEAPPGGAHHHLEHPRPVDHQLIPAKEMADILSKMPNVLQFERRSEEKMRRAGVWDRCGARGEEALYDCMYQAGSSTCHVLLIGFAVVLAHACILFQAPKAGKQGVARAAIASTEADHWLQGPAEGMLKAASGGDCAVGEKRRCYEQCGGRGADELLLSSELSWRMHEW